MVGTGAFCVGFLSTSKAVLFFGTGEISRVGKWGGRESYTVILGLDGLRGSLDEDAIPFYTTIFSLRTRYQKRIATLII